MTYTLATLEDTTLGLTPEETALRTHVKCLEVEHESNINKLQAIIKRGELYSEFKGTQEQCGENFKVSQPTVSQYIKIYNNKDEIIRASNNLEYISGAILLELISPKQKSTNSTIKDDVIEAYIVNDTVEIAESEQTIGDAQAEIKKLTKEVKALKSRVIELDEPEQYCVDKILEAINEAGSGAKLTKATGMNSTTLYTLKRLKEYMGVIHKYMDNTKAEVA